MAEYMHAAPPHGPRNRAGVEPTPRCGDVGRVALFAEDVTCPDCIEQMAAETLRASLRTGIERAERAVGTVVLDLSVWEGRGDWSALPAEQRTEAGRRGLEHLTEAIGALETERTRLLEVLGIDDDHAPTAETCPGCLTRAAVDYVWNERQADGVDDDDTPTLLDSEICTAADDLAHMGATVDAVGLLAWSRMHVDQRRAALPALLRCYVHHAAAETALRTLPHDDGADTTPVLHWPAPGLSTTTLCQGEPLTAADFAPTEAEVTCPECRAHLGHAVDAEADTAEAESKPEDWLTWTLYRPGKDGPDDALKTGVRKRSATDPADLAREKLEQHAPGRPDWFVNVYGLGEAGPGVLAWAEWKGTHGTVRTSADVDSDTETEA